MRYAAIRSMDVANGSGIGVALFTQGCRNHCMNCHNPGQWDFNGGDEFGEEQVEKILELCKKPWIKRFTLLGGEPLEPENHKGLLHLVGRVREARPDIEIWLFTGLVMEDLMSGDSRVETEDLKNLINAVDIVVDGPYVEAQHSIALRFKGSANQRIIDVAKSREAGRVVEWKDDPMFEEHSESQLSKLIKVDGNSDDS